MVEVNILSDDGQTEVYTIRLPAIIGRGEDCSIRLKGWRVSKQHIRVGLSPAGIMIEDLGSVVGTYLNGRRVLQCGPLSSQDQLHIANYTLCFTETRPEIPALPNNHTIESSDIPKTHALSSYEEHWRRKLHARLLDALDLRRRDITKYTDEALRIEAQQLLEHIVDEAKPDIPDDLDIKDLIVHVLNEALGLGPLEVLLSDPSISEIMVNAHNEIYIERAGKIHVHPIGFSSPQAVVGVIERIVAPIGRRIDESSPMVDARLKDGSRVNAVIAPIALKGACLTIRKFPERRLQIQDLMRVGSLDQFMADFLSFCVKSKLNILISGGTGSGKTTLLNILSGFIPDHERLITIEDAAELRLNHTHLISLEARPPNLEGKGAISIRDLVRNALRMRPDRIVVGECRGAEALDMLQAMNTGHEGSLTSLHANAPRDALARLETMILMAGMDLPLVAIREQIASAVDIIIQQNRLSTGQRLITSIVEVTGLESGKIQLQELFKFDSRQSAFIGLGMMPQRMGDYLSKGLSPHLFQHMTPLSIQHHSEGEI